MHRLAALKPRHVARIRRGFSVSRISRNTEIVESPPPPPPSAFTSYLPERRLKSIGLGSLQPRETPDALVELDERVRALEAAADVEEAVVQEANYTEQELTAFYQDILAIPPEDQKSQLRVNEEEVRKARAAEDAAIVEALYERFDVDNAASTSDRPYLTILSRLESIVSRLEAAERLASPDSATQEQKTFPISILSPRECEALVRVSMKSRDIRSAEQILDLMKRTGLNIPEESITDILRVYAHTGNAFSADNLLVRYLTGPPAESQRHLHIQAHLNATAPTAIPNSALEILHSYENQAVPAPMETYTSVITSLFSRPSSIARGQAWDLFSHMRYVAHPDPDVLLYTLMIRACASPLLSSYGSEAEKALDLWTEMTVDHRLTPTLGAYNAVILACARDGSKEFVSEAFRIARQMLDSHRNAEGVSAYRPDRKTFAALLEGAKRIGDLARVRWILAEMTRSQEGLQDPNAPANAEVDEEIMLHVFNAYAAYKPPFARSATKIVKEVRKVLNKVSSTVSASSSSSDATTLTRGPSVIAATSPQAEGTEPTSIEVVPEDEVDSPSFAHIPPQTHGEVVQEAEFLFRNIRIAHTDSFDHSTPDFAAQKFRHVQPTSRLVNAYMSVLYNHSSLHTAREKFWSIYNEVNVPRTARSYVEAFERCANAKKNRSGGHERELALTFSEEIWKEWAIIESQGHFQGRRLDSRMIERANIAMVRVLTLNNQVDRALDVVRAFADRYRPQNVRTPPPKPLLRSTRTVLAGSKPLVRMTGATDVPDDYVPPVLSFKDIEVLHHQLVAYGRVKDIGYLKWLCKAYEWALRVRRDEATKYVPPKTDKTPVPVPAAS